MRLSTSSFVNSVLLPHPELHLCFRTAIIRTVNKQDLVNAVIQQLMSEMELLFKAARASHAEATHEQSKAEDKYDTRGLEASYLARGQSRQAAELEQSIAQFRALPLREFKANEPIDVGA